MNLQAENLFKEIRYGIPSKRMIEVVSVGMVKHNDKLFIFKCRYEEKDVIAKIKENPLVFYNDSRFLTDFRYQYRELLAKNVVFSKDLLHDRAIAAIEKLEEMKLDDFINRRFGYGIISVGGLQ